MDQPTHVHLEDSEYAPRKSKDSHRPSSCEEKWEEEQDYQQGEENYRNQQEQQQPQEFEQDEENYYNDCGEEGNGQWDDCQQAVTENEKIQDTKRKILYGNDAKNAVEKIDIYDLKRQFSLNGSDQTPLQPQHRVHIHNSTKNSPKKS